MPLSFCGCFLFFGTVRCSRLIWYFPCLSPGVSDLSKDHLAFFFFLLVQNGLKDKLRALHKHIAIELPSGSSAFSVGNVRGRGNVYICAYTHFLCTLISMSTNTFLKLWVYTNSNLKPTRFIPIFSLSIFVTYLQEFRSLKQTPTKNTFLRFSAFSLPARLKKKNHKIIEQGTSLFCSPIILFLHTHTHTIISIYIYFLGWEKSILPDIYVLLLYRFMDLGHPLHLFNYN